ncbi:ATP-binding protein [Paenibacillus tianmuensis]|nr:ATP-binding protein [Paenibacillus tianmuensis]
MFKRMARYADKDGSVLPAAVRLIVLLVLIATGLSGCSMELSDLSQGLEPRAAAGRMDLSGWDWQQGGIVALNGEWEFYGSKLLTPESFRDEPLPKPEAYFMSPGYWNSKALGEQVLPVDGFASLRLLVDIPPNERMLAIKVNNIFTAYRVWVNGELLASAGIVSKEVGSAVARQIVQTAPFQVAADRKQLEIVVQMSNYSFSKSGLQASIQLGTAAQIEAHYRRTMEGIFIAFGACAMMSLYHLVLYGLRRSERSALYLGLFSLLVAVRILFVNDRYIYNWFPNLDWEWFCKIPYAVFFFSNVLVVRFVHSLYPRYFAKSVVLACQAAGLGATLFCLFTPLKLYDRLLIPFQLLTCALIVYVLYVLIRALRDRQSGALVFMIGFAGLSGAVVHDILYLAEFSSLASLTPFGLLLFIVMQSLILAGKFVRAFMDVEQLSNRLLAMDKLKDEFLAHTSHELRTPLHGMIGLSESLVDGVAGKLPEQAVRNLELVITSGRRLATLVGDVLDYAQLKHKELNLHRTEIDLRSAVDAVLRLSEPLLRGKTVALINEVPEGLTVLADENRMQQILHNVIGNAVKFTEDGSIAVTATTVRDEVEIRVTDTGIGIDEELRERIFGAYEQGEASAHEGTGLGLAVTKKLVELHGGTIRVESPPGGGTWIIFTLPTPLRQQHLLRTTAALRQVEAVAPQGLEEERPVRRIQSEAMRLRGAEPDATAPIAVSDTAGSPQAHILIVDDEPINLQVLRNHLTLEGYAVWGAVHPNEALRLINDERKPDLVVLDVMLPKMSGFEVCSRIRERYSASELPVIFLTAKPLESDLLEGFGAGANDYVTKPVVKRELLARIKLHLQLTRWNQTLEQKVKERTELLEEALATLHEAKNRLIQSEKLASLGGMVAGVAHEINSPIGIGVTASSHLAARSRELLDKYGHGQLGRKELETYFAECEETASILLSNLQRTEKLIASFKQVAADRTDEEPRTFRVKAYIGDILQSLSPKLKKGGHRIVLEMEESLEVCGYPGAFYQIITNLVLNSQLHAFDSAQEGTIIIRAESDGHSLMVTFSDDGKGIDSRLLPRIFDPFVTTKRGQGGTGLGLSVVYNLVVQTWGGTIICDSVTGCGTAFQMALPVQSVPLEEMV